RPQLEGGLPKLPKLPEILKNPVNLEPHDTDQRSLPLLGEEGIVPIYWNGVPSLLSSTAIDQFIRDEKQAPILFSMIFDKPGHFKNKDRSRRKVMLARSALDQGSAPALLEESGFERVSIPKLAQALQRSYGDVADVFLANDPQLGVTNVPRIPKFGAG